MIVPVHNHVCNRCRAELVLHCGDSFCADKEELCSQCEEAAKPTPPEIRPSRAESKDLLADAVYAIHNRCDGARTLDGEGWNRDDRQFVEDVGTNPKYWNVVDRLELWHRLGKYRRQLLEEAIDYADIPMPRTGKPTPFKVKDISR